MSHPSTITAASTSTNEIIFIEDNIKDFDKLIEGLAPGTKYYVLDSKKNGLQEIADILSQHKKIDTLHLLSYGSEAAINLGQLELSSANLTQQQASLQSIAAHLNPGADIKLYGCNIASGNGAQFLAELGKLTGVDIAASVNKTGDSALGGDWTLEYKQGHIDGSLPFSNTANFHQVLDINEYLMWWLLKTNKLVDAGGNSASKNVAVDIHGDSNYRFVVDGSSQGVMTKSLPGTPNGLVINPDNGNETEVAFYFEQGQLFNLQNISIRTVAESYKLRSYILTGYDAEGKAIAKENIATASFDEVSGNTLYEFYNKYFKKVVLTSATGKVEPISVLSAGIQVKELDKTPPTVTQISFSDADLAKNEKAIITISFSEEIIGFPKEALSILGVEDGNNTPYPGAGSFGTIVQDDDKKTYKLTFTPTDDLKSEHKFAIDMSKIKDFSGNAGSGLSKSPVIKINTKLPPVTATMALTLNNGFTALKAGANGSVSVNFSENVNIFSADLLSSEHLNFTRVEKINGKLWQAYFNVAPAIDVASNSISLDLTKITAVSGAKGESSTKSAEFAIDSTVPVIEKLELKDADLTTKTNILTITFSEKISKLDKSGLLLGHGSISNLQASADGKTWTAVVSAEQNYEGLKNVITLKGAAVYDAAGNQALSDKTSDEFKIDSKLPTGTISIKKISDAQGEKFIATFSFSEVVKIADQADLLVTGGTLKPLETTDNKTYTAEFFPDKSGATKVATIKLNLTDVKDVAGNPGASQTNYISTEYQLNTPTEISATLANQTVLETGSIAPFKQVILNDADADTVLKVTIKLDDNETGKFTASSLTEAGLFKFDETEKAYIASASPEQIQAALRKLVFQPNQGRLAIDKTETSTLKLSVFDGYETTIDQTTSIVSKGVNQAPHDIQITQLSVSQSAGLNALIGTLKTSDINPGDTHTYTLAGNQHANNLFKIEGNSLIMKQANAVSGGDYQVVVTSRDAAGLSYNKSLIVTVKDDIAPVLNSISCYHNPVISGGSASYLVKFSEAIKGLNLQDFELVSSGSATGKIASISVYGSYGYLVNVEQISGSGSLGLNLKTTATGITDLGGLALKPGYIGSSYKVDPNYVEPDNSVDKTDSDKDGIAQDVEAMVPNLTGSGQGDGNGDGIADTLQHDVSSLTWHKNTVANSQYLTLFNHDRLTQNNLATSQPSTNFPKDVQFNYGVLNFSAEGLSKDNSLAHFTLNTKDVAKVNGYWLQDRAGNWSNVADKLSANDGKLSVSFKIEDGGQFDLDGQRDGKITAAGALAYKADSKPAETGKPGDSDNDGIPDDVEIKIGTNPAVKDNQVQHRADLFTMQLYRDVLFREADNPGLAFWTKQMDQGLSKAEVASNFIQSDEFQTQVGSLARLYFGAFNRVPDKEGLQFWVNAERSGMNLETMANFFVNSKEFQQSYGALDNSGFLNTIYQNVLHRSPDNAGKAFWMQCLEQGMSRATVLSNFTESQEFKASSAEKVTLTLCYVGLLGQAPDPAVFNDTLNQHQDTVSLIGQLISSQDFLTRFN